MLNFKIKHVTLNIKEFYIGKKVSEIKTLSKQEIKVFIV